MKPWDLIATASLPDGSWLELRHHDDEWVIRADGYDLMSSRVHGSEDAMMSLACPNPPPDARVLVGGLGLGYTLRATLELLPPGGRVTVAELVPEIIEWNREHVGDLAGHPIDDPRTEVFLGDVANAIRQADGVYDAILLDVDNGPDAMVQPANRWLYSPMGLSAIKSALKPGAALAVWSVGKDRAFEERLAAAGFDAYAHRVVTHRRKQVVFVGTKRDRPVTPASA